MKTLNVIMLLIYCITIASCRNFISKKYKLNRPFDFATKEAYVQTAENENEIISSTVYYLPKEDYGRFINAIKGELTIYYGSFVNDSVSIKKSHFLKDNESCMGRMKTEIKKNLQTTDVNAEIFDSTLNLSSYSFYSVMNNQKMKLSSAKKLHIILLYSYAAGVMYKDLYKEVKIAYEVNKKDAELYVISLDPVYTLK